VTCSRPRWVAAGESGPIPEGFATARKATRKTAGSARKFGPFIDAVLAAGARRAKTVRAADVVTGDWVRWKCQYGCDGYGSSRMCPPHTPTPEQTRRMLDGYQHGILFEAPRNITKGIAVKVEREVFLAGYYKALGLGSGPCQLCATCSFEEGCRHAEEARPAMEACGIDVFATARKHGFTIDVVRTRKAPQHYFGLVLIE
jgi:predicted metal-binding protein